MRSSKQTEEMRVAQERKWRRMIEQQIEVIKRIDYQTGSDMAAAYGLKPRPVSNDLPDRNDRAAGITGAAQGGSTKGPVNDWLNGAFRAK